MKKIYVLALSLMMVSFSYGQRAQMASSELKSKGLNQSIKTNKQNTPVSTNRSIQASFFEGFEGGLPETWTVIDNDGDGSLWHTNGGYDSTPDAFEGDSCATVLYNAAGNDDWLISPAITIADGDELSFYAASTGEWLESFNVKVSTSNTEVASFTIDIASETEIAEEFAKYSYILTDNENINADDEIFIAIQCVSINMNVLRIDNFKVETPATEPIASLSRDEFNFGYVDLGENVETVEFSLSNVGINTITVSEATDLSGTDFTTTFDATAVSIEAEASYTFTFTYTPSDLVEDIQDFVITTNVGELTISLSGNGVTAPEGTLIWDNSDISFIGTFTSTKLGALTPGEVILADDFEVTSGQSWTISTVVSKGSSETEAVIDHFGVKIFSNNNGLPGEELFSEEVLSLQNNDFSNQTLVLENPYTITTPGKYWISVFAIYDDGDDLETSNWGALLGSTTIGDDVALRDMGGVIVTDGTDWLTASTSFTSLATVKSTYIKIFGETEALTDPIAAIDQVAFNFGYVDMGASLTTTEITLSNIGGGTVTATSVTDLSASDFTTTFDATTASATLETPYTFTVTYAPSDLGEDTQDLVIETNSGSFTISLSGIGVATPQGTELWDNTEIGEINGIVSNDLGALSPGDVTSADDFEIETGASWKISSIVTSGGSSTAATIDHFTVKIYSDNNGTPSVQIFSENITSNQNNSFFNQTLELSTPFEITQSGKYWISIYAVYSTGDALATSRWNITTGTTGIGSNAMLKDSPDLFGEGATNWTALNTIITENSPLSLYFKIFGDITTNVNTVNNTNINLFPNPTTGIVNITNTELNSVEVYNMVGQVVSSLENVQKIDLSSFENGTYIVKVISENNTTTKKVNLIK